MDTNKAKQIAQDVKDLYQAYEKLNREVETLCNQLLSESGSWGKEHKSRKDAITAVVERWKQETGRSPKVSV